MKQFFLFLLLLATMPLQAQTATPTASSSAPMKAGDVFRHMPDSILPYLSENNRLDMLDFMESHMRARVQNQLDGYSEMLSMSDDSLTIQMSSAMCLTLRLLPSADEIDGARQFICLERTVSSSETRKQQNRTYYSVLWRKLEQEPPSLVK